MDVMDHFRLMWRRRWFIAAVSLVVAASVFAWSRSHPKVYQAAAVLDVISEDSGRELPVVREELEIVTGRFAVLTETASRLEEGVENSGLAISVDTARGRVSASAEDLGFVEVRATGPSPASAEALAEGMVEALVADNGETPPEGAEEQDAVPTIHIVTPATASLNPVEPKPERDALLALLISLVATAELAALVGTVAGRPSPAGNRQSARANLAER